MDKMHGTQLGCATRSMAACMEQGIEKHGELPRSCVRALDVHTCAHHLCAGKYKGGFMHVCVCVCVCV